MTNREIIISLQLLQQMAETQDEAYKKEPSIKKLPSKVAFAIHKNKKKLMDEYKTYEETLDELNKRYGVESEDGRIKADSLSDDEKKAYIKEVEDIQLIDVNVDIHKISEADFGEYEPTLKELDTLSFMMTE